MPQEWKEIKTESGVVLDRFSAPKADEVRKPTESQFRTMNSPFSPKVAAVSANDGLGVGVSEHSRPECRGAFIV